MTILTATAFDYPMGTDLERHTRDLPPGKWHIALGFLIYYTLGYHTGVDTAIEPGGGKGEPVHACANGEITYAQRMRIPGYEAWGNIIIERCYLPGWSPDKPNDRLMYIRYAHSDPMYVKAGDHVRRGQVLSLESDAFGTYYPHLHFDFSPTNILYLHPEHWPGQDRATVAANYVNPFAFIRDNRPMVDELDQIDAAADEIKVLTGIIRARGGSTTPVATSWVGIVATNQLNVRDMPTDIGSTVIKKLAKNDPIEVGIKPEDKVVANGHVWLPLKNPILTVPAWVAGDLLPIPNL